jgi:hypothetical protein
MFFVRKVRLPQWSPVVMLEIIAATWDNGCKSLKLSFSTRRYGWQGVVITLWDQLRIQRA